jgi:hypothetical protein
MTARDCDGDARWYEYSPTVPRQQRIDARVEIEARVIGMRLGWQWEVRVESANRHDQR